MYQLNSNFYGNNSCRILIEARILIEKNFKDGTNKQKMLNIFKSINRIQSIILVICIKK